jgi:cation:H+ antiporter
MLVLLFILGIAVLSVGAELFVRGASRLATMFGVSSLIIGLTVVAYGTSAPEVAVVVQAGFQGQGDMAFGNIIGSNISNFMLILGISALLAPLVVSQRLIRLEVPLLLVISAVVFLAAFDGQISRVEGGLLVFGAVVYTVFVIQQSRGENRRNKKPGSSVKDSDGGEKGSAEPKVSWIRNLVMLLAGLAGLVLGANWLVTGATGMARILGISELVIGLTVVAVGTSLPELATSIAATLRGERDLAIGNVIGSNLFNLLLVLGVGAALVPQGLAVPSSSISFDIPVMIAVTAACLPLFFSGYIISRGEGFMLLVYYAAYTAYLLLFSVEHDLLPAYSTVMLRYILPLTAILLVFVLARTFQVNRRRA